uniref:Uncharacterized protein n=1 Tax=Amphimedon queenslandica TaxID=400682 RepID=A0A1X7V749_AMPQE
MLPSMVLAWHKDCNAVLKSEVDVINNKVTILGDILYIRLMIISLIMGTFFDQWCFHTGEGASFQLHRFHIVIFLAIEYI